MRILIGGDFYITPAFLSKALINEKVKNLFVHSDFNLINLECPVIGENRNSKIQKTGPHIRTDNAIFNYLKQLNIHAVTLANNHILDYGLEGLQNTLECCRENKIQWVGAGTNEKQAAKSLIIDKKDVKIAVVNFCENEWSVATSNRGGANPMNFIDNYKQIQSAKEAADFVIAIVHGGHEYYPLPSPRMVKQYRFYANLGADAVIGHHTHCISGYEIYENVPIVYSLGNFLFTLDNEREAWYNGLIAQLQIEKNKPVQLELIPLKQDRKTFNLSLLEGNEKEQTLKEVENLSEVIKDNNKLQRKWEEYCKKNEKIVDSLSPINYIKNKYLRAILKRSGINRILLNKNYLKSITNRIRCEAHRDLITDILTEKLKDK